jgi:hypothetical protein
MVFLAGYPGVLKEDKGNEIGTFFACIQDELWMLMSSYLYWQ